MQKPKQFFVTFVFMSCCALILTIASLGLLYNNKVVLVKEILLDKAIQTEEGRKIVANAMAKVNAFSAFPSPPDTTYQLGNCVQIKYQRLCPDPGDPQMTITLDNDDVVQVSTNGLIEFNYINNILGQKGDFNSDAVCWFDDIEPFVNCFSGTETPIIEGCNFAANYNQEGCIGPQSIDLYDFSRFQIGFGTGNFQTVN